MSLLEEVVSQGKKKNVRVVNVEDVRPNKYNFYHVDDEHIQGLAISILNEGQLEEAIVYEDNFNQTGENDGRKYTLISGESRWRAICSLVESGEHSGDFKIEVIQKPEKISLEVEKLREYNRQRSKSFQDRYNEIKFYESKWENNKVSDEEKRGLTKKRDWVAMMCGCGSRTVDNIKKKFENEVVSDNQDDSQAQNTYTEEDVKKMLKRLDKLCKKCVDMEEIVHMPIHNELQYIANSIEELLR